MREQLEITIKAWIDLYIKEPVTDQTIEALADTIYYTAVTYKSDSQHNKRKWAKK